MDAEATMSTGDAVVSPAVGDETPTPAKASAVVKIIVAAIWKLLKTESSKETENLDPTRRDYWLRAAHHSR